jgi:hypothetical protein
VSDATNPTEACYQREASQLVVAAEARTAWGHIEGVCRRLFMGRQVIKRLCATATRTLQCGPPPHYRRPQCRPTRWSREGHRFGCRLSPNGNAEAQAVIERGS